MLLDAAFIFFAGGGEDSWRNDNGGGGLEEIVIDFNSRRWPFLRDGSVHFSDVGNALGLAAEGCTIPNKCFSQLKTELKSFISAILGSIRSLIKTTGES